MRISASEVAQITHGTLIGADATAEGIAFDTRNLSPRQAFVAIVGDRDGNDFLDQAAKAGASFALVSRGRAVASLPCVEVDDTTQALGLVAKTFRLRMTEVGNRVVGITGSAGKTSTKNFVSAVLKAGFSHSYSAEKSLNNDIGVPATILNAPDGCDALTLEMGMRGFGEIARLCDIATPTIAVVTNVGDAHGERVGGQAGIAKAKSEIVQSLSQTGVAILNADDPLVVAMSQLTNGSVVTFGSAESAHVKFHICGINEFGCAEVEISHGDSKEKMQLGISGAHMASNAAAAIAVGLVCGMTLKNCVTAIELVQPEDGRMQWHSTHLGQRLLNDSYNANVASMRAALETFGSVPAQRRVAVLGKMNEIPDSEKSHADLPMFAAMQGIEVVALETELYGTPAFTLEQVVNYLNDSTIDAILVKGSRASATERVVQALIN